MITYSKKPGSTDVSVVIRIIDAVDGTPETGVTSATSGIDLEYRREGAVVTNITESDLSALNDAHSDGGMLHIGGGYYRLDLPDAAVAAGAAGVLVTGQITGMVVIGCYIQLDIIEDAYQAKVWMQDDNGGGEDHYSVIWFKNSAPIFTGITSPKIQVVKDSDGTDLIAEDDMTEIGSTGMYKYVEGTARMVSGESYKIVVSATIDGSARQWVQGMGRDSS